MGKTDRLLQAQYKIQANLTCCKKIASINIYSKFCTVANSPMDSVLITALALSSSVIAKILDHVTELFIMLLVSSSSE